MGPFSNLSHEEYVRNAGITDQDAKEMNFFLNADSNCIQRYAVFPFIARKISEGKGQFGCRYGGFNPGNRQKC
jgi:hypothetical protein